MTEQEQLNWILKGYRVAFEYETLPADQVRSIFRYIEESDAYVSRDSILVELTRLKETGFRWIRTEGDHAIFERAYLKTPNEESN